MRFLLLLTAALFVAGCESLPDRVTQRFAAPVPQERVLELPAEKVFFAVQQALVRLNYQLTKTAQAQGIINAQSRLLPTERFGSSDQYVFEVRLRALDGGATSVSAVLFEQSEGQFRAGATSTPVREHGRYESFFETLEQVLGEPGQP
jgi:hypothetical protein